MTVNNSDIISQISIREYATTKQQTLTTMAEYCHMYLRTPATHAYTTVAKILLLYGLTELQCTLDYLG